MKKNRNRKRLEELEAVKEALSDGKRVDWEEPRQSVEGDRKMENVDLQAAVHVIMNGDVGKRCILLDKYKRLQHRALVAEKKLAALGGNPYTLDLPKCPACTWGKRREISVGSWQCTCGNCWDEDFQDTAVESFALNELDLQEIVHVITMEDVGKLCIMLDKPEPTNTINRLLTERDGWLIRAGVAERKLESEQLIVKNLRDVEKEWKLKVGLLLKQFAVWEVEQDTGMAELKAALQQAQEEIAEWKKLSVEATSKADASWREHMNSQVGDLKLQLFAVKQSLAPRPDAPQIAELERQLADEKSCNLQEVSRLRREKIDLERRLKEAEMIAAARLKQLEGKDAWLDHLRETAGIAAVGPSLDTRIAELRLGYERWKVFQKAAKPPTATFWKTWSDGEIAARKAAVIAENPPMTGKEADAAYDAITETEAIPISQDEIRKLVTSVTKADADTLEFLLMHGVVPTEVLPLSEITEPKSTCLGMAVDTAAGSGRLDLSERRLWPPISEGVDTGAAEV